jgi:hypothetical protein
MIGPLPYVRRCRAALSMIAGVGGFVLIFCGAVAIEGGDRGLGAFFLLALGAYNLIIAIRLDRLRGP